MNNIRIFFKAIPLKVEWLFFRLVVCLLFSLDICAQPGYLDNTFAVNGVAIDSITNSNEGNNLICKPDGGMILYGNYSGQTNFEIALISYNPDGSLNNTFGTNGIATSTLMMNGRGIAIGTNSNITVAGWNLDQTLKYYVSIAQFLPNGNLNTGFGTNGSVTLNVSTGDNRARSVAIQPDGKILVAGDCSDNKFFILRLNPNGALDNTFGLNGVVTTTFQNLTGACTSMTLQQDGKIILGGWNNAFLLLRYLPNGDIDNSFGTNGIATNTIGGATCMTLQNDGKILMAGGTYSANNCTVLRFNSDGSMDTGFGNNGVAMTPTIAARSICVQQDNKIVVGGRIGSLGVGKLALVRFNENGSLDNAFGNNGITLTDIGPGQESGETVRMQTDGKILVSGSLVNPAISKSYFLTARFESGLVIGMDETVLEDIHITLFPNPCQNILTLNTDYNVDKCEGKIFNSLGEEIKSMEVIKPNTKIDLSEFPNGIYLLQLSINNIVKTYKILKT